MSGPLQFTLATLPPDVSGKVHFPVPSSSNVSLGHFFAEIITSLYDFMVPIGRYNFFYAENSA